MNVTTITRNKITIRYYGEKPSTATVLCDGKTYQMYSNDVDQLIFLWESSNKSEDYVKTSVCDIISNNIFNTEDASTVDEAINQTIEQLIPMIKKLDMLNKLTEIAEALK